MSQRTRTITKWLVLSKSNGVWETFDDEKRARAYRIWLGNRVDGTERYRPFRVLRFVSKPGKGRKR